MPYIGIFTEERIQKSIERAAEKLGDGESGLVAHVDDKDEVSVSVIKRFGTSISIEAVLAYDISQGFNFDKDKLAIEANLVWKWK